MQSNRSYWTTPQARIHSGFGPSTTAREVVRGRDLMGQNRHRNRRLFRDRSRDNPRAGGGGRDGHCAGAHPRKGPCVDERYSSS
jgi:hypothetical protein